MNELGVSGLSGDDGEMYFPSLGMSIRGDGGGGSIVTKPLTDAEKAAAVENQKRTQAMFDALQADVDAKAKAVAAAQEAAKAKAIADAVAAGKSQAEIDQAAKNAQLKVLLDTGPIVGTAPPAVYVTPKQMEEKIAAGKQTTTVIVQPTPSGPMIVEKVPDFWDNLLKGWNDFVVTFKKTLNIK
jgi:histidyl-tRNA synthetase